MLIGSATADRERVSLEVLLDLGTIRVQVPMHDIASFHIKFSVNKAYIVAQKNCTNIFTQFVSIFS